MGKLYHTNMFSMIAPEIKMFSSFITDAYFGNPSNVQGKHTNREANKHPSFLEVLEHTPTAVHLPSNPPPLCFCTITLFPLKTICHHSPNPPSPSSNPPPCFVTAHKQILEVCQLLANGSAPKPCIWANHNSQW